MKRVDAAIIFCILATSASCGGRSDGGIDDSLPTSPTLVRPPTQPPPTQTTPPDDEEALPGVAGPLIPEQSHEEALPCVAGPALPGQFRASEFVRDIILGILDNYCGACHGRPSDAEANAVPGSLEFTDDIDRMVALGIIEPLNGASSPLVRVMVDGSMPPLECGPRPPERDVETIRQFIDNPNFWD